MLADGDLYGDLFSVVEHGVSSSPLPSPQAASSLLPQARANIEQEMVQTTSRLWSEGTQVSFSGLMANVGVPAIDFGSFMSVVEDDAFDLARAFQPVADQGLAGLPQTMDQLWKNDLVQEVAAELAEVGMRLAGETIEMLPVIGWVVGMVLDVTRVVTDAVQAQRRADFPALYPPEVFSPENDLAVYKNFVLPALQSGPQNPSAGQSLGGSKFVDLTPLFLPPANAYEVTGNLSPFARRLEADGTVAIAGRTPLGLGLIPGSGKLHAAIDTRRGGLVGDLGLYLPTARNQAAWLWQGRVLANEPALFSVDAVELEQYWSQYLYRLRKYLAGDFQDDPTSPVEYATKAECAAALGQDRCKKSSGKGFGHFGYFFDEAALNAVIDFYADPAWFGWADSTGRYRRRQENGSIRTFAKEEGDEYGTEQALPIQACRMLQQRQWDALDTTSVAYLDESYIALQDSDLWNKWQKRRGQLLEHHARCGIDLDDVPTYVDGGIYLESLVASGVGSKDCMGGYITGGEQELPGLPPPPLPQDMDDTKKLLTRPARVKKGRKRRSSGAGAAVVVLGAAALVLLNR